MIVIVIGMHRSGSSALSGLLHQNGICMGEVQNFSPGPSKENPKGFFENYRFRHINDQILFEHGYSVKLFDPDVPICSKISEPLERSMRYIIASYQAAHPDWGFKDPRTCLTLNFWKKIFTNFKLKPKFILIKRPIQDIASSMVARGNEGKHQQFIDLANAYYAIANLNHHFDFIVHFKNLINDTDKECKRISNYLKMPIINNGFIEKRLTHR